MSSMSIPRAQTMRNKFSINIFPLARALSKFTRRENKLTLLSLGNAQGSSHSTHRNPSVMSLLRPYLEMRVGWMVERDWYSTGGEIDQISLDTPELQQ